MCKARCRVACHVDWSTCRNRVSGRRVYSVRLDLRTIDAGIRDAVTLLSRIPGVTTRASCEGAGSGFLRRRHADLAYVALRYPMPPRLQDFFVEQLDSIARVECDGIYSRWPEKNGAFLRRLERAARAYVLRPAPRPALTLRWPLSKLRARLARLVSREEDLRIGLCRVCADLVDEPHDVSHESVPLLRVPADQQWRWFADFAHQPHNALDPGLVARDGWQGLTMRTLRGDFGAAFHRRWLRHRARMIAALATAHLRSGVQAARRHGTDIDFFYDGTHAVCAWR